MPDFEPDHDSVSHAEATSSRLINDLRRVSKERPPAATRRKLFSESRYSEQAKSAPIHDVLANVNQMATEFAAARRWGGEIPCMKLNGGELAPISFSEFLAPPTRPTYGASEDWLDIWDQHFPFRLRTRLWRKTLKRLRQSEERVVITDIREALEVVQRNLTSFLSYRFAGMQRSWTQEVETRERGEMKRRGSSPTSGKSKGSTPPPPPVGSLPTAGPPGVLRVQVSSLTPGLRIHVANAYFINWVYFGSPTTPVVGYVLPGRYVFAGDGPTLPNRTEDPTVFCIPNDFFPAVRF